MNCAGAVLLEVWVNLRFFAACMLRYAPLCQLPQVDDARLGCRLRR